LENQSTSIVKAIQDSFGIRASEDDIRASRTLGDLAQFLRGLAGGASREQLQSAAISCRLQLGLREACGIAPNTLTPKTRLETLFPRATRREKWYAVEDAAQITLPSLAHARWLAVSTLAVCLFSMGVGIALFWNGWSTGEKLFALIVAPFWPFMLWWMALYFTRGVAKSFSSDCQTFGDLVNRTSKMNSFDLPSDANDAPPEVGDSEDLVWKLLQALIAVETGRELEEVFQHTQLSEII
jgi:hypothetical protein